MLETADLVRRVLVPILIGTGLLVAALLAMLLIQRGARALAIRRRARIVHRSLSHRNLVVLDKANAGKADAINAGINLARHPLVCVIDADSLLEEQALTRAVLPFLRWPETIAAGGIVRIANGCTVEEGRVVRVALPRSRLALFQVVEYLRAFLAGRVAMSAANGLLIISGAFGLFRRDAVIEAGGFRHDTVGEDMELVVRLHRLAPSGGVRSGSCSSLIRSAGPRCRRRRGFWPPSGIAGSAARCRSSATTGA